MSKKNKEGKNKDEHIDNILDDVDEDAVNDLIKSVQKEVKEEAENQKNNPEVKKKKKKKKVEEEEENEEDEKEEFRKWKEQKKLEKLKKEKMESQKKKKKKKKDSSEEDDDDDQSDSYEDEKPKKKKKKKKKKYDSDEEDEEDSESDEEEYRAREPDISGKNYKKLKQENLQFVLNYLKKNNLKFQEGINLYNEGNYEDSLDYLTHAKKSFGDLNKLIQEDKNSYPKEFRNDLASKINEKIKKIDESIKKCSKKLKEKASKNNTNQNNNSNNYNYSFNPMNNINNNANINNNNQNKQQNLHDKEEDEMDKKIESEIMVKNPNVKFGDIIGMNDMKQTLYEIIIVPQIRPDFFTGIRKPQRGILLFGPPGTGKTMIAKAIASECKSTFFNISASSLTSKWVGESEKTVKSLFKIAYKKVPSIIFIDEIDSILSKRSENENEATKRLKTEFLIQFDGLGSNTNAKLLVIAATNRPMDLDEALLRRLPKRVYCGPLDENGRFEFIKKVINRVETNLSDDDIREIAKKTNDYSNSDLMELCREAAYQPVRELTTDEILKIKKFRPLVKQDLLIAVQKIRGTLSKKVRDELQKWNDQFGGI